MRALSFDKTEPRSARERSLDRKHRQVLRAVKGHPVQVRLIPVGDPNFVPSWVKEPSQLPKKPPQKRVTP